VPGGADDPKEVAALHGRLQREWDFFCTSDELLEGDAAAVLVGKCWQRLVHDSTVCYDNIGRGHRKVQELPVLDLDTHRETLTEQHAAAGHHDNDVASVQHGLRGRIDKRGVATNSFNKHAFPHKGLLQISDATTRKNVGKAIRPDVPLSVAGTPAGRFGGPRGHLRFELLALGFQINSEQPRRKTREKPDDEAGPNQIAHRVRDRDVVQQSLLLGVWQIKPGDRVTRRADDRALCEGSRAQN
jgi:hypothetical protein